MVKIKLAERVFLIKNKYSYFEKLCVNYISQEAPQIVIEVTEDEIIKENKEGGKWSYGYLESLAIYRKICDIILDDGFILFHGSAIKIDGNAYIFAGPSGIGKSTHVGLWRECFGNRVIIINDDKPILKITDEEIKVYGTPYGGKRRIQTNTSAPLKGIIVLHQGKENIIKRTSRRDAYPILLNQVYRRGDAHGIIQTMDLVNKLSSVDIWSLECNISEEAVLVTYRALQEGKVI